MLKLIVTCHQCLSEHGASCAGPCPCPVDGVDISEHWRSGCPRGLFDGGGDLVDVRTGESRAADFHAMWDELHARPLIAAAGGFAGEPAWQADFDARVRALAGCTCGRHWDAVCVKIPVDYSSPLAYARSGWARQNEVNLLTNPPKPAIEFEEAVRIRGWERLIETPSKAARSTDEGR
jgi:hypothetical protein